MNPHQLLVRGALAASRYRTTGSDYDGTEDLAARGAGLTGLADGKQGLFSAWIRIDGGDGAAQRIMTGVTAVGGGTFRFQVERDAANLFRVRARNAAGTLILSLLTVGTYTAGATHLHIMSSWKTDTVGARHLYINDTSDLTAATFTDDTIDYTLADWGIGGSPSNAERLDGCLYELFFHPSYLDLSVESNRRRFISVLRRPAPLGFDGSLPLGVQPVLYAPNGDPSTNRGSGGNFTVTGALTAASTSPSD